MSSSPRDALNEDFSDAARHAGKLKHDFDKAVEHARDAAFEAGTQFAQSAGTMAKRAAKETDIAVKSLETQVREHPWAYVAGAAAVGALVGIFLANRRRH